MKLSFDLSVLSSRQMAGFIWLLAGAACISDWPLGAIWIRLVVGLAGLILGASLFRKRIWLVRHPPSQVLLQIQYTLQSTCIAYELFDNSIQVTSTGTKAHVRGCGPISLVEFHVVDSHCNKERFLLEVLTKYFRFIRKKDADG